MIQKIQIILAVMTTQEKVSAGVRMVATGILLVAIAYHYGWLMSLFASLVALNLEVSAMLATITKHRITMLESSIRMLSRIRNGTKPD